MQARTHGNLLGSAAYVVTRPVGTKALYNFISHMGFLATDIMLNTKIEDLEHKQSKVILGYRINSVKSVLIKSWLVWPDPTQAKVR